MHLWLTLFDEFSCPSQADHPLWGWWQWRWWYDNGHHHHHCRRSCHICNGDVISDSFVIVADGGILRRPLFTTDGIVVVVVAIVVMAPDLSTSSQHNGVVVVIFKGQCNSRIDLGGWITFPLKWNVTSENEVACSSGQEKKIMSLF